MKTILTMVALLGLVTVASADETMTEKGQVMTQSTKRAAKKAAHRAEEAMCGKLTGDSKVKCMANQVKNRAVESKDVVRDKTSEIKNSVDKE